MRALIIKLADALYEFDDAHPLLAEVDSALANPDDAVGLVKTIDPIAREAVISLTWVLNGALPKNFNPGDKVYTHPRRQQEPLSVPKIREIGESFRNNTSPDKFIAFAREIEKAHGIGGEK